MKTGKKSGASGVTDNLLSQVQKFCHFATTENLKAHCLNCVLKFNGIVCSVLDVEGR